MATEFVNSTGYLAGAVVNPAPQAQLVARDLKDFEQFPDKSKLPQKVFTWEELEWYNGEQGRPMYLAIDNKVYDMTLFADMHPGGPAPLKTHAGQDASLLMQQSCKIQQPFELMIQRFKVGCVDKPKTAKFVPQQLI